MRMLEEGPTVNRATSARLSAFLLKVRSSNYFLEQGHAMRIAEIKLEPIDYGREPTVVNALK